MPRKRIPVSMRFDDKWVLNPKNGCWEWTACTIHGGYGAIVGDNPHRCTVAHRISWIIHNGKVPDGLKVLHKCDNKKCVNPDHLYLGTTKDNSKDAFERGQMSCGTDRWNVKLSEKDVDEIRRSNLSQAKLAKIYPVWQSEISRIINNKRWRKYVTNSTIPH